MTNKLNRAHFIYLFISIYIYVVLLAWLFPYKGPEMCQVFCQVSFLNDTMSLCWPPANRCIANSGFGYRYMTIFGDHKNAQ